MIPFDTLPVLLRLVQSPQTIEIDDQLKVGRQKWL